MSYLMNPATGALRMLRGLGMAAMLAASLTCQAAGAGDYPAKSIRFVVPFTAGGLTDRLARTLAHELQEAWGQPVIVENRPGAGGTVGADAVAKAQGDGYTILMGTHATHAINVSLMPDLPYDAKGDFVPVSLLATVPSLLLINPAVPAASVQDLVALAKKQPGVLNYSSQGVGTSGHMAGEHFKALAGIDMVHVPAKGPTQALTDLVGHHVDILFDSIAIAMPMVRSGKIKALAVTSRERSATVPDLPTMREAGVPDYEIVLWFGVFAPKGTPEPIVAKLNRELVRILAMPAVHDAFVQDGVTLAGTTPQELAKFQQDEIVKWAALIKASGAVASK